MKPKEVLLLLACGMLVSMLITGEASAQQGNAKAPDFSLKTATPSEECGACHVAIYREYAMGFGGDLNYKGIVYQSAKEKLLTLAKDANAAAKFEATFMVSALTGDGVGDLKTWLAQRVPYGPWLYPADQISEAPMRQLAAEVTREKLFERLHQELPYHSTVETDVWKELRRGDVRIEQTIYVERESQRKIVLGKGGQTIKAIGEAARKEIAEIADAKVHLFLFVKVREDWGDDPERYRAMGLEFPKE